MSIFSKMPFNYDLDRMKKMMADLKNPADRLNHGIEVPKFDSAEATLAWLEDNLPKHLKKKDYEK